MRKFYILCVIALTCIIIGLAFAEQMTLTTYYPAPHGVYNDMVVMNSLGVGTTDPGTNKLEVVGGPIKATGGLIIETRTSDPASPATGQIWLRTDF